MKKEKEEIKTKKTVSFDFVWHKCIHISSKLTKDMTYEIVINSWLHVNCAFVCAVLVLPKYLILLACLSIGIDAAFRFAKMLHFSIFALYNMIIVSILLLFRCNLFFFFLLVTILINLFISFCRLLLLSAVNTEAFVHLRISWHIHLWGVKMLEQSWMSSLFIAETQYSVNFSKYVNKQNL